MKKGLFLKTVSYLFMILITFITYLFIYLFPALKTINDFQVKTKDYQLRINDIRKADSTFEYSDEEEKKVLAMINGEFKGFSPFIDNSGVKELYLKRIRKQLKNISENTGFKNIFIDRVAINDRGFNRSFNPESIVGYGDPVCSQSFNISFTGSTEDFIGFLKKLRSENKLFLVRIVKGKVKDRMVDFIIDVDSLYRNRKSELWKKSDETFLDLNSPVLSKKVYRSGITRFGE